MIHKKQERIWFSGGNLNSVQGICIFLFHWGQDMPITFDASQYIWNINIKDALVFKILGNWDLDDPRRRNDVLNVSLHDQQNWTE